jgi:hypothetical protein
MNNSVHEISSKGADLDQMSLSHINGAIDESSLLDKSKDLIKQGQSTSVAEVNNDPQQSQAAVAEDKAFLKNMANF